MLWQGVRHRLPAILLASLLLAGGAYLWAGSRPPVYEASNSLLATNPQGQDTTLPGGLGKAPTLPSGVVDQVMKSPLILGKVIDQLQHSALPEEERNHLVQALQDDLRTQQLRTVTLESDIQPYNNGSGIYTVHAFAGSAQGAKVLADLAGQALLNWDRDRALEGLRRSEAGFQAQAKQVERQLSSATSQERQALLAQQSTIQSNLVQLGLLEESVTGVLSQLTTAVEPGAPISPRPLRTAALVGLISLMLGLIYSLFRTLLDRSIRSEDDLLALSLPTLAVLPQVRKRDVLLSGIVRAGRSAGLYESVGYLRVNLMSELRRIDHPIVMITSTAPGEGKSSLTATLADGFASSGQRVLVVDIDLRRGTQAEVWEKNGETANWVQLVGHDGAQTTREALLDPYNVQVLEAETNVHVLPAGPGLQDSMQLLNRADLTAAFALWRQHYDIVLVDSAPLLALADGLVVGKHADGVILVTEAGETPLQAVKTAVSRAKRNDLKLLGAVINKMNVSNSNSYTYSYNYNVRS